MKNGTPLAIDEAKLYSENWIKTVDISLINARLFLSSMSTHSKNPFVHAE